LVGKKRTKLTYAEATADGVVQAEAARMGGIEEPSWEEAERIYSAGEPRRR